MGSEPEEFNLFLSLIGVGVLVILPLGLGYVAYRFLTSRSVERLTEDSPATEGVRAGALSLIGVVLLVVVVFLGVMGVTAIIEFLRRLF